MQAQLYVPTGMSFLYDVTGGDWDMVEGLQISVGASLIRGQP